MSFQELASIVVKLTVKIVTLELFASSNNKLYGQVFLTGSGTKKKFTMSFSVSLTYWCKHFSTQFEIFGEIDHAVTGKKNC